MVIKQAKHYKKQNSIGCEVLPNELLVREAPETLKTIYALAISLI